MPAPSAAKSSKSADDLYIALMRMAGYPSRIHMRRRAHWCYARWKIWMFPQLSRVAHVLVLALAKASVAAANAWRSATANQAGRYRPEAHYMRGPGPKWRAKHAHIATRHELGFNP